VRFDVLGQVLPPESFFAPSGARSSFSYWASILAGGALLVMILFLNGAYENRTLLRFRRFFFRLCKSLLTWLIAFAGLSLILEFDERLSRVYVIIAFGLLMVFLVISRFAVQRALLTTQVTAALRQRILFVDWTDKTEKIAQAALRDMNAHEGGCAQTAGTALPQPPRQFPLSADKMRFVRYEG
jgi:FlaA1/EpsC-like NDP-sugar epimerase